MAPTSPIERVAIIGATGRMGRAFAEHLVKTGKHRVTALTRAYSKSTPPDGVKTVVVDYSNEESLVAALKGQQFVAITLSVRAPPDTHDLIVKAAAKAGVPYVMPNIYGLDTRNESLCKEEGYGTTFSKYLSDIESTGVLSYFVLSCGFWYEWSLALGENLYGFTIKDRKVTFFDEGKILQNTSTWDQCGRALAALLSLPESGASPSLEDWKNDVVYISSFTVSQRDMLDSLHRVLGTTDKDWEITYESSAKRYQDGKDEEARGIQSGYVKRMYSRIFFPSADGHFEKTRGLANEALGLPKEDLDTLTKRTVDMVESGWNPFA